MMKNMRALDALSRSYEYKIWMGRNPFLLDFSWQIHSQDLNIRFDE